MTLWHWDDGNWVLGLMKVRFFFWLRSLCSPIVFNYGSLET